MNKPVYFVTKEKRVTHIGFFTKSQITLVESEESLIQQGFTRDPLFFRETDDAIYIFSSWLPQSLIALWIDHIITERADLITPIKKGKRKKRKKEMKKRRKKSMKEPLRLPKKPCTTIRMNRPPTPPTPFPKRVYHRKKTVTALQEERKTQKKWGPIPVCGDCTFWEKRILPYTQTETGECTPTGNLVSCQKTACPEFQRATY
jgi:hypothetical protein